MKVIFIYYIKSKRSRGEPSISINPNETHARRRFFAVQEESSGAFRASFISYDPVYRSPYCSFLLQQLIEELPNDRFVLDLHTSSGRLSALFDNHNASSTMATIRRLSDEDVKAVFDCVHNNRPPPADLPFHLVNVGPNGLKLSPPSYEFEGAIA